MNIYSIYKITNTINDKVYIGYTSNFNRRLKEHKQLSVCGNTKFYKAIRKYGWENFNCIIIYQSLDKEFTQNVMENFFILEFDSYNCGYNGSTGGEGINSETRSKIVSNAWKNPDSKYNSPEHRKIKSKNLIELRADKNSSFNTLHYKELVGKNTKSLWEDPNSKFNSEEYVEKQSNSLKKQWEDPNSKFNSEEYRKKKSDAWKNPNSGFQKLKRAYIVTDPFGNIFNVVGLRQFCRDNDLRQSSMTAIAQGKCKQHKGWKCVYND